MPDSACRSQHQFPLQERRPAWWSPRRAGRLLMVAIVFAWLPDRSWKLAALAGLVAMPAVRWGVVLLAQRWVRRLGPSDPDGWQGW
ncbi:hypothetical protein AB3X21_05580 [Roseomonas mucosa]